MTSKAKAKENIQKTLRHIQNVFENREILAMKLVDLGELELARLLLLFGIGHDQTKFSEQQFGPLVLGLGSEDDLKRAINAHNVSECHHPSSWDGIHNMPDQCIAEFVCDVKARSSEFGEDIRKWIDEEATKRYNFTKKDKVYEKIVFFLDLLLEKPFKKLD
jgi:hypothetical protein